MRFAALWFFRFRFCLELLGDLGDARAGPPVVGLGGDRAALLPPVALPSVVQTPLRLKGEKRLLAVYAEVVIKLASCSVHCVSAIHLAPAMSIKPLGSV